MGSRQSDLFALATKHRLPTAFKNDAIGVFYDAKANVTQMASKLKLLVQEKQSSLVKQVLKPTDLWL